MFLVNVLRLSSLVAMTLFVAMSNGADNAGQIFTINPVKAAACHYPMIMNCNSSLYPILDYQLAAWFYHAPFKSCRPLYTAGGVHNCTGNQDLPTTKEHCENLCGEPCKTGNGTDGICMMDEYCKPIGEKASAHPRPCGAYNVKCCPRSNSPSKNVDTTTLKTNSISEKGETRPLRLSARHWSGRYRTGNDLRNELEHSP